MEWCYLRHNVGHLLFTLPVTILDLLTGTRRRCAKYIIVCRQLIIWMQILLQGADAGVCHLHRTRGHLFHAVFHSNSVSWEVNRKEKRRLWESSNYNKICCTNCRGSDCCQIGDKPCKYGHKTDRGRWVEMGGEGREEGGRGRERCYLINCLSHAYSWQSLVTPIIML